MSWQAHHSEAATQAATQTCQTLYGGPQQGQNLQACRQGAFDGLSRVSGVENAALQHPPSFQAVCQVDATTVSLTEAYAKGCQSFAHSWFKH